MTERVIIQIIWAGVLLLAVIIGSLAWIAVTHDGTNESQIVAALISIITAISGLGASVFANWLGAQHVLKGITAQQNASDQAKGGA